MPIHKTSSLGGSGEWLNNDYISSIHQNQHFIGKKVGNLSCATVLSKLSQCFKNDYK